MNVYAIGIPTLNRYDLLIHSLVRYQQDFPGVEIHIVDNGQQDIQPGKNVTVHVMPENIGVAASWNFLCMQIFKKHKIAFILNDDIYWGVNKQFAFSIVKTMIASDLSLIVSNKTWCCFGITKSAFHTIKGVDEAGNKFVGFDDRFYPAYFEDNDYHRRLILADKKYSHSKYMDPAVYRNSMTLEKDKSINDNFMKNKEYYIRKWGGEPGQEKFVTAFNK